MTSTLSPMVGAKTLSKPACHTDTMKSYGPCGAWPEPKTEPPEVFGHDCRGCAMFTRNPPK